MYTLDLPLNSPWLNAAGTLGYSMPARWLIPQTAGAFVTNPVSRAPRTPAAERCLVPYAGGFLLHTGHPNPGMRVVLRKYSARWQQSPVPVWLHLLATTRAETQEMIRRLEGVNGISAIELGLPPDISGDEALALTQAAYGELPLAVHIGLNDAAQPWVAKLREAGAAAVTLGAPRGMVIAPNGHPVSGRLLGPGLFPQMLAAVHFLKRSGVEVIAGAGIFRLADAQALLDAGALAVQLDAILWRGWAEA